MLTKELIADTYKDIQDEITSSLESLDGKSVFEEENWKREGGGGGRTRIIQNGDLIEKGGVNFSAVHGKLPAPIKKAFGVEEGNFFATGVSIVLHPHNPHVPIIHMNIRYFELNEQIRWFGGGIDLTPHYIDRQKARDFHVSLKNICDRYHADFYRDYKKWADDYFFIKHRNETRGIGGIFYDKINTEKTGVPMEDIFDFSCDLGRAFPVIYADQAKDKRNKQYSEDEKNWQLLRRGRYVEFNLVYDAGTKFGLETNGRIESILMSLPLQANWFYNFSPEPDSKEAETLQLLKKDIDWSQI